MVTALVTAKHFPFSVLCHVKMLRLQMGMLDRRSAVCRDEMLIANLNSPCTFPSNRAIISQSQKRVCRPLGLRD